MAATSRLQKQLDDALSQWEQAPDKAAAVQAQQLADYALEALERRREQLRASPVMRYCEPLNYLQSTLPAAAAHGDHLDDKLKAEGVKRALSKYELHRESAADSVCFAPSQSAAARTLRLARNSPSPDKSFPASSAARESASCSVTQTQIETRRERDQLLQEEQAGIVHDMLQQFEAAVRERQDYRACRGLVTAQQADEADAVDETEIASWFSGEPASSASDAEIAGWYRAKPASITAESCEWFRGHPASSASDAQIADWFRGQPAEPAEQEQEQVPHRGVTEMINITQQEMEVMKQQVC